MCGKNFYRCSLADLGVGDDDLDRGRDSAAGESEGASTATSFKFTWDACLVSDVIAWYDCRCQSRLE